MNRRLTEKVRKGQGGDSVLGIFRGDDIVGSTGLHRRACPAALEIGYWIAVGHLRQGYATEVSGALTIAAFSMTGI
jgi:RimJ/RimL family protein N-acetyltransferase